jgi:hypothetical protein
MLGLFKSKDQTGNIVKDPLLRTWPVGDDENDSGLQQHQRLAAKLGVRTVQGTGTADLVVVLKEMGARLYDFDKVENFMSEKADKLRRAWHWYPLRERDKAVLRRQDLERDRLAEYSWQRESGSFSPQIYPDLVPLPVLITVDSLVEKLDDRVSFYIGALGEKIDPFLGVRLNSAPDTMFVVERWDEPSFR